MHAERRPLRDAWGTIAAIHGTRTHLMDADVGCVRYGTDGWTWHPGVPLELSAVSFDLLVFAFFVEKGRMS